MEEQSCNMNILAGKSNSQAHILRTTLEMWMNFIQLFFTFSQHFNMIKQFNCNLTIHAQMLILQMFDVYMY